MISNQHILQRDDGSGTKKAFREWLHRQLFGDTAISLDKRSLIFGAIFFISMAVAAIVATILGLGTAAALAALSAMLVLIAVSGGSLGSDLRLMVWFGPGFILLVGGVHLLAGVSPWWTIPVIVISVFIAGLLPAFSSRYTTVGTALALGVLIGFGIHLPSNIAAVSIFAEVAVGFAVAVLMRLILGIGDPSLATRRAIARVLTNTGMDVIDNAWKTLRADRSRQWMYDALRGAEAYRVARLILSTKLEQLTQREALHLQAILDEADKEAEELAGLITAKKILAVPAQHIDRETTESLSTEQQDIVANLWQSMDTVRRAVLKRDGTPVTVPVVPETSFDDICRTLFSWDSNILRHALRCSAVVLVALVIATLNWGNPLNSTLLTATFTIMHPTRLGTVAKALQRTVGAIIGACIAGGLALIVPPTILLLLAIVVLFFAFPFMLKNMTIYYAMITVMTLLLGIATGSLPASTELLEYLLYIAIAVLIALFFVFVVPRVELDVVKQTYKAMNAMRTLLLSVSEIQRSSSKVRDNYILAARAAQNLQATSDQLTKASPQMRAMMTRLASELTKMLAEVSALKFRPIVQSNIAAELSIAEQLLDLNNARDAGLIMEDVRRSTFNESELLPGSLVDVALAASQSAKQLLALEGVATVEL